MTDRAVPTAEIIWAWPHPSSKGVTVYQTALHADGKLSCTCPGWTIVKPGKSRGCKHTRNTPDAEIQDRVRKHQAGIAMTDKQVFSFPAPNIRQRRTVPELPTLTGGRMYQDVDPEEE
jgi:hypothetical protein